LSGGSGGSFGHEIFRNALFSPLKQPPCDSSLNSIFAGASRDVR
jgi:hypothetical protein